MQHSIPYQINNIPARDDVQDIPEFSDLATKFPAKKLRKILACQTKKGEKWRSWK